MPPLSDSPIPYLPSHIAAAASRILAAYLTHNRISAVEAARLAVRVESVLAELVSGGAAIAVPQPAELETASRRTRRAAPVKTPRSARPNVAAAEPAAVQVSFDLGEGPETETETETETKTKTETATETEAKAEVPAIPAEQAPPAAVVEERQEIDLLTGGPLPPATEPDYPAMPAMPEMPEMPVSAESPGTPGKKRKRPPRPASQRRAARVAAIEQMLVEGEEPPEGEVEG